MKILFVAHTLDRPESHLVRGLIERGIDVGIILEERGNCAAVLGSYESHIFPIALSSRIDISAILKMRTLLRRYQPDIVHSFSARGLSNALLASIGMPCQHVAYRGTMGNLSRFDPTSWMSFLNPRLRRVICVSNAVREDLIRRGVSEQKAVRIYKGHDSAWYHGSVAVDRSVFSIPAEAPIIACVANSRAVKGIDTLVEAFHLLPTDHSAHLLLIGEIRDQALIERGRGDSRIHFLGFRSDACSIVACADIFCMPSRRREGFPKALIEAMIQGVPAVVTNVGGLPEIVRAEETGLIVEPDDPGKLSQALLRLMTEKTLCKKFGEYACVDIRSRFTISTTIEETLAVYNDLLDSSQGQS